MLEFAEKEKKFQVILNSVGKKEDDVYKLLCQITGKKTEEVMTLCENLPVSVFETEDSDEAHDIVNRLSVLEADATVEEVKEEVPVEAKPEPKKELEDKGRCRYNPTIIYAILIFAFLGAVLAGWCLFKTPSAASNQNTVISAMQSEKGQVALQSGTEKGLSSKTGQIAIQKAIGSIDPALQAKIDQGNREWSKILDNIESGQ